MLCYVFWSQVEYGIVCFISTATSSQIANIFFFIERSFGGKILSPILHLCPGKGKEFIKNNEPKIKSNVGSDLGGA